MARHLLVKNKTNHKKQKKKHYHTSSTLDETFRSFIILNNISAPAHWDKGCHNGCGPQVYADSLRIPPPLPLPAEPPPSSQRALAASAQRSKEDSPSPSRFVEEHPPPMVAPSYLRGVALRRNDATVSSSCSCRRGGLRCCS